MAVNEQIVTGRKFRKLIDEANKLWQRISFWTKASDVEFNDGKNAETKLGAINGVTDSLTSTASNIAASAKAVKALNDKVTQLSSNLARRIEIPIKLTAVMIPASSSNPSQQRSTDITIVIENGKATVTGTPSTGVGIDSYGTANASVTVGKPVIDK